MVPWFFVGVPLVCVVLVLQELPVPDVFRAVNGEFMEDRLDGVGEEVVDLRKLLRR